jgi:hypothetical protein
LCPYFEVNVKALATVARRDCISSDIEWAKQAQQRAVSSVNCYFVNFAESNVS